MVPPPGSTAALRRHSKTSDSEKGGMTMPRMILIMLVLMALATALALGKVRGMHEGGLMLSSAGLLVLAEDSPTGQHEGGL